MGAGAYTLVAATIEMSSIRARWWILKRTLRPSGEHASAWEM
jgi:hypothetical protein